jgi:cell division protein FtsQ
VKLKKNVKILLIVLGLTIVAVIAVYFSGKSAVCSDIIISYNGSEEGKYIDNKSILTEIREEYGEVLGISMSEIGIASIEQIIDALPQVKDANVYRSAQGLLHIEIDERIPLLRIFTDDAKTYYLDTEGLLMPVSKKTPARVLVATGNIHLPDSVVERKLGIDSLPDAEKLYRLVNYINADSFLASQIQQIHLSSNDGIILIPRVGSHDIVLGTMDDYENKLRRLRYFYFNIIGNAGWNKYKRLNLSYDKQIVAVKQ